MSGSAVPANRRDPLSTRPGAAAGRRSSDHPSAIYRTAWAELTGVPVERVRAAFYYVRTGRLVAHDGLPERADLERLLGE